MVIFAMDRFGGGTRDSLFVVDDVVAVVLRRRPKLGLLDVRGVEEAFIIAEGEDDEKRDLFSAAVMGSRPGLLKPPKPPPEDMCEPIQPFILVLGVLEVPNFGCWKRPVGATAGEEVCFSCRLKMLLPPVPPLSLFLLPLPLPIPILVPLLLNFRTPPPKGGVSTGTLLLSAALLVLGVSVRGCD